MVLAFPQAMLSNLRNVNRKVEKLLILLL